MPPSPISPELNKAERAEVISAASWAVAHASEALALALAEPGSLDDSGSEHVHSSGAYDGQSLATGRRHDECERFYLSSATALDRDARPQPPGSNILGGMALDTVPDSCDPTPIRIGFDPPDVEPHFAPEAFPWCRFVRRETGAYPVCPGPPSVCFGSLSRVVRIGRTSASDVCIPHHLMSKAHATLTFEVRQESVHVLLQDTSANGTWVNSQKLKKGQLVDLRPQDRISFVSPVPSARSNIAYEVEMDLGANEFYRHAFVATETPMSQAATELASPVESPAALRIEASPAMDTAVTMLQPVTMPQQEQRWPMLEPSEHELADHHGQIAHQLNLAHIGSLEPQDQCVTEQEVVYSTPRRRRNSKTLQSFEVLGAAVDDDADTIRQKYRDGLLRTHPDRGGSHEKFLSVQESIAYIASKRQSVAAAVGRFKQRRSANPEGASGDVRRSSQHAPEPAQSPADHAQELPPRLVPHEGAFEEFTKFTRQICLPPPKAERRRSEEILAAAAAPEVGCARQKQVRLEEAPEERRYSPVTALGLLDRDKAGSCNSAGCAENSIVVTPRFSSHHSQPVPTPTVPSLRGSQSPASSIRSVCASPPPPEHRRSNHPSADERQSVLRLPSHLPKHAASSRTSPLQSQVCDYLPLRIRGVPVLLRKSDGYLVENSQLKSQLTGLTCWNSTNCDDKGERVIDFGSTVDGIVELSESGVQWLRVTTQAADDIMKSPGSDCLSHPVDDANCSTLASGRDAMHDTGGDGGYPDPSASALPTLLHGERRRFKSEGAFDIGKPGNSGGVAHRCGEVIMDAAPAGKKSDVKLADGKSLGAKVIQESIDDCDLASMVEKISSPLMCADQDEAAVSLPEGRLHDASQLAGEFGKLTDQRHAVVDGLAHQLSGMFSECKSIAKGYRKLASVDTQLGELAERVGHVFDNEAKALCGQRLP